MIYGTYQLPDGTWQAVASFQDADEARQTLEFHAAGREWKMAKSLARLERDTGGSDWIQDIIIARTTALGMTAYALAQATDGAVSEDHVRAFLTRKKSMGSFKLQHVLRALGLTIVVA